MIEEKRQYINIEGKEFEIKTYEKKQFINRDFKGVWIPKEIWINEELKWIEKLFLTEIESLDKEKGCYASNKYFAGFFQLSESRSSEVIKSLFTKGYISREYLREGKEIKKRILRVTKKGIRKTELPIREIERGYSENAKENNTLINNTININKYIVECKEIISYLNEKAEKNYRNTESNYNLIRPRLKEGFSIDDIKIVIDKKSKEWKNTNMDKYLRLQTLMQKGKFEGYLNEKEIKQIPQNIPLWKQEQMKRDADYDRDLKRQTEYNEKNYISKEKSQEQKSFEEWVRN
jgi:uncharacterized phage protein (TIGR02220 family)